MNFGVEGISTILQFSWRKFIKAYRTTDYSAMDRDGYNIYKTVDLTGNAVK